MQNGPADALVPTRHPGTPGVEPLDPRQIAIYRRMTGEQRARIGFEISDFVRKLALAGIRHRLPGASDADVRRLLNASTRP